MRPYLKNKTQSFDTTTAKNKMIYSWKGLKVKKKQEGRKTSAGNLTLRIKELEKEQPPKPGIHNNHRAIIKQRTEKQQTQHKNPKLAL
jgi:hypothetical protein